MFFHRPVDAAVFMCFVCFLRQAGLSENGGGVQGPGRRWHHWSRGGLPQYDRLQKGKVDSTCVCVCATKSGLYVGRNTRCGQWPVDRLLTAHWSASMCIYHTQVSGSLSFHHLETNSTLSLSLSVLQDHLPTVLYHHYSGKLQPSNVLISSQSHQWGFGQREVLSVSRVITSSPWRPTFQWLLFDWRGWAVLVANYVDVRLGGSSWFLEGRDWERPMRGWLFLLNWRIACYFSASTLTEKKSFDQT